MNASEEVPTSTPRCDLKSLLWFFSSRLAVVALNGSNRGEVSTPWKASFYFFSLTKLVRLFILKKAKYSLDRKKIKLLRFDNFFPPLRHSRQIPLKNDDGYHVFPQNDADSRNTSRKSRTRSRPRPQIYSSVIFNERHSVGNPEWCNLSWSPCVGREI